uniref:Uncharacterized protein n=1 Tax=Setaria digitata TaxID=48799 RepID=A0A915PXA3_9BILA
MRHAQIFTSIAHWKRTYATSAATEGKNETIPLAAIVTPPYFSYSPEEVISSVIGFPRFSVKPSVFTFTREPVTFENHNNLRMNEFSP